MTLIAEGKTKQLFSIPDKPDLVRVVAKTDITAGNGERRDSFAKKDEYATATTSAVFRLLNACGVPTAFVEDLSPTEFIAKQCAMIPLEVVMRRIALGSYVARHPDVARKTRLETPVVEFFLKTTDRKFGQFTVPKDDPIIVEFARRGAIICRADMECGDARNLMQWIPFGAARGHELTHDMVRTMETMVANIFFILEAAWQEQGCSLGDIKVEFGITPDGVLVAADTLDNDSWRLFDEKGEQLDKQRFRDKAPIEEVAKLYAIVAHRIQRFSTLQPESLQAHAAEEMFRMHPSDIAANL